VTLEAADHCVIGTLDHLHDNAGAALLTTRGAHAHADHVTVHRTSGVARCDVDVALLGLHETVATAVDRDAADRQSSLAGLLNALAASHHASFAGHMKRTQPAGPATL
jgi:hypothetical protein